MPRCVHRNIKAKAAPRMSHVHIIGAGLAGLSAALTLSEAGQQVTLYEAGPAAGGRCRSYFDRELGLQIDNGNHLLLSGNTATFAYIDAIGSAGRLAGPAAAVFPFVDLATGERWTVRPNRGRVPWWIGSPGRRVPGTGWADYLGLMRVLKARGDTVVADAMPHGPLYRRLLEPLAIAALNTRPETALARLLGTVMRETLLRGGSACIPRFPRDGLSEALIDPALTLLQSRGAAVHFNRRVAALQIEGARVVGIQTTDATVAVPPDEAVLSAVPPWIATGLLPDLVAPTAFEAILNIHFRIAADAQGPVGEAGFIGVLGGIAEWVFIKQGHVSVTISAANRLVDDAAGSIAEAVWPNVVAALALGANQREAMPAFRVVKERRATFAATAEQERRRPGAATALDNLAVAGDWTATGLPATIEGAIRSGRTAAAVILAR
jgi:squalene-associated FAD-dependent desaturase